MGTPGSTIAAFGVALEHSHKDIEKNEKGIPVITFTDAEMQYYSQELKFTLVGKFSYGYPVLHTIKNEFYKFNLSGEYFVGILNVRHILIKLSSEQDYLKIWGKGLIWMDKFPMRILKWTMDFNPAVESSIVSIWVKLPELPYYLFHKSALTEIARTIGNPLKLDYETEKQSRPAFARICIELDIFAERPNLISIEMGNYYIDQKVIYENIPRYCTHCKHLGHDVKECKWNQHKGSNKGTDDLEVNKGGQGKNLEPTPKAPKRIEKREDKVAATVDSLGESIDNKANNSDTGEESNSKKEQSGIKEQLMDSIRIERSSRKKQRRRRRSTNRNKEVLHFEEHFKNSEEHVGEEDQQIDREPVIGLDNKI